MDRLKLLAGENYQVTPHLVINNPTLGEVRDFPEEKYWGIISAVTATAYDYRVLLDDSGIDYVGIEDYEMFLMTVPNLKYENTKLIFPDIHFEKLEKVMDKTTKEIYLVEIVEDEAGNVIDVKTIIDRSIYHDIVDYIRQCHGYERNWLVPGNKMARKILIDDERERLRHDSKKPFESKLEPLVSALCNMEGFKYNYETVWDLPIFTFFNALHRIDKIRTSNHTYAMINSGFFDMKKANKAQLNKDLNWKGEL